MDSIIETCPGCARRLRVPTLRGPLALTCPSCRRSWDWSPPESLTQFEPDPTRLEPFKPFTTLGDSFANHAASGEEWIRRVLSLKTVVYGSGRIAREGDVVRHDVAPAELALCRRLADEARDLLRGKVDGGLGSEGHMPFDAFSIAANRDDPPPARIDGKSLYVVVATTTAAACTTAAWRCGATRPMLEAFRSRWAEGSFALRSLMASAVAWPMLVNLAFRWDLLLRAMLMNAGPWILVPGLLATILDCRLAFMAGEALVSAHQPRRAA
jgi:hypothetical protein